MSCSDILTKNEQPRKYDEWEHCDQTSDNLFKRDPEKQHSFVLQPSWLCYILTCYAYTLQQCSLFLSFLDLEWFVPDPYPGFYVLLWCLNIKWVAGWRVEPRKYDECEHFEQISQNFLFRPDPDQQHSFVLQLSWLCYILPRYAVFWTRLLCPFPALKTLLYYNELSFSPFLPLLRLTPFCSFLDSTTYSTTCPFSSSLDSATVYFVS